MQKINSLNLNMLITYKYQLTLSDFITFLLAVFDVLALLNYSRSSSIIEY